MGNKCPWRGSPHHLTNQVWGGAQHHGQRRGLFNVSRYSYGHRIIGPCQHFIHRSVLTSHRNPASDVVGWNSMLDGVRNTHCTAPEEKKKGKPRPCKQTQPQLHPGAQLFKGSFETVYCDTQALPSPHQVSREIQWKWFWWDASTWDKSQRQQEGKKNSLKESHGCTLYGTEA